MMVCKIRQRSNLIIPNNKRVVCDALYGLIIPQYPNLQRDNPFMPVQRPLAG